MRPSLLSFLFLLSVVGATCAPLVAGAEEDLTQPPADVTTAAPVPVAVAPENTPVAAPSNEGTESAPRVNRAASFLSSPSGDTKPAEAIETQETSPLPPPVETSTIADISAESTGVLVSSEDGLGATMWADTPRAIVERLLSALPLPTNSATLNNLARRLLLTTAAVPSGEALSEKSLTTLRVEKTLALGRIQDANQLAFHVKDAQIDDVTLRNAAEASLLLADTKNLCARMPDLLKAHAQPDWQKLLVICQIYDKNIDAATLSIDVMREQKTRDDVFLSLVSKNIVEGSKIFPRQMSPLKASTLALLRQINLPLPADLYLRPDPALIPVLAETPSINEIGRLILAEKAARQGTINGSTLASIYEKLKIAPEMAVNITSTAEADARIHVEAFQVLKAEKDAAKKIEAAKKIMLSSNPLDLTGALGSAMAENLKDIPPISDYNLASAIMTRLFAFAGYPENALAWYKLALNAGANIPSVDQELKRIWPILVLSGIISDADYAKGLKPWLSEGLKDATPAKREKMGSMLLLFSSFGYAVPEETWGKVTDISTSGKRIQPPSPVLMERLRVSGTASRKGEAALLAMTLAKDGATETPLFVMTDIIRSLRLNGLMADAQGLAREAAIPLLDVVP